MRHLLFLFWLGILSVLPGMGFAAAVENVIPDGSFEKRDASGVPVGWSLGSGVTLVAENGNHFLRVVNDRPGVHVQCEGWLPLPPKAVAVTVSARMRARDLRVGIQGYQTARLQYLFENTAREMVGAYPPCPELKSDSPWRMVTVRTEVPEGAAWIKLMPALYAATGTLEMDDVRVQVQLAGQLPPGEQLCWGEEPVEIISRRRAEICLNGLWKFQPAAEDAAGPGDDWGYIRVPGTWQGGNALPGIVARGGRPAWKQFDGNELAKAWYERTVRIPAAWKGREILLRLQRVSTDAVVYANGKECGRVDWPSGTVAITNAVTPGTEARLRLLVVATPDPGEVLALMGPNQNSTRKARLQTRGLIGDVLLESRPAGAHVSDVFVQTFVRPESAKRFLAALPYKPVASMGKPAPLLGLSIEVADVQKAGTLRLRAHLLNPRGQEEKQFTATVPARAAARQVIQVAWPWPKPRLWDVGKPELYTLKLEAQGAGLADEYAQPFGFREFWIAGRKFFLNGTEIRLRPVLAEAAAGAPEVTEVIDGTLDSMAWAGFNIAELWPNDQDERGTSSTCELWAARADRKGLPLMGPAMHLGKYLGAWRDPATRARYAERMAADLRNYRNHPSILLYSTSGNVSGHGDDQNPRRIGMRHDSPAWRDTADSWQQRLDDIDAGVALIKRQDPTRPVMIHQGGPVSDVYALNSYLDLIPLQEREEWLSAWAKQGQMPYLVVEFGTPLSATMLRGRDGIGNALASEPLMSEYCAIYLGADAYRLETPEYRARVRGGFMQGQQYQNWHNAPELDFAPALQRLEALFSTNTWRSWRTMGMTGGMLPWARGHGWQPLNAGMADLGPFQPGRRGFYVRQAPRAGLKPYRPEGSKIFPGGQAIIANDGPTLAWIAGPAAAFTTKDHHFRPGQRVEKQAVLINDTRRAQPFSYTWQALLGGKRIASGSGKGSLATAATRFIPLTFSLPRALAAAKSAGEIRLSAAIGTKRHSDTFSFRVFTAPAPLSMTVTVFDPVGRTTPLLKQLGCTVRPWNGQAPAGLVVIGREALSSGHKLPAALEAFVRGGGRVLICQQQPQWIGKYLGLRTAAHLSRRLFPVAANHPVLAGLDADDLRDWNGKSTLTEAYPDYIGNKDFPQGTRDTPCWGWHWGNRGAVASCALEKPHHSGWRPILECEFDLAYSPLMELDYGRGRILWSQLDLEDHAAIDPAAARLASQVLRYAAAAPLATPSERTVYLGGEAGAALLDSLGARYEKTTALPADARVAILGADAAVPETELRAFLEHGGKALFLAQRQASAGLGVGLAAVKNFGGSLRVPDWPECRGLSPSDLRWRCDQDAWLLQSGVAVGADGLLGRLPVGRGVAIFSQLDPEQFAADEKTYFRFTRWRQTRALAQILANLGVSFAMDDRVFHPAMKEADRVALAGTWQAQITRSFPPAAKPGELADPGISAAARQLVGENAPASGWEPIQLPQNWSRLESIDGEAVFRTAITVPQSLAGKEMILSLGKVDDYDDTFFNGVLVGHTDISTPNSWNVPRSYAIPTTLVRPGKNVIAVRVFDNFGGGGFNAQPWQMTLAPKTEKKAALGFYSADYREDFELGDDPYRYFRW